MEKQRTINPLKIDQLLGVDVAWVINFLESKGITAGVHDKVKISELLYNELIRELSPNKTDREEAFKSGNSLGGGRFHVLVSALDDMFLQGSRPEEIQLFTWFNEPKLELHLSSSRNLERATEVLLKPSSRHGYYSFSAKGVTDIKNPNKLLLTLTQHYTLEEPENNKLQLSATDQALFSFMSRSKHVYLMNIVDWQLDGEKASLLSPIQSIPKAIEKDSLVIGIEWLFSEEDEFIAHSVGIVKSNTSSLNQLQISWFKDFGFESTVGVKKHRIEGAQKNYNSPLNSISEKDKSDLLSFVLSAVNKDKFGQFLDDNIHFDKTKDNRLTEPTNGSEENDNFDDHNKNDQEEIEEQYEPSLVSNIFNYRDKSVTPALGVVELAEDVARILVSLKNQGNGNMFGIFGKWGRGKTYLIDKISDTQKVQSNFIKIDFHAWKYQSTPASWAYLYEAFAERYFDTGKKTGIRKWFIQSYKAIGLNVKRWGTLPIWSTLLGLLGFMGYTSYNELIISEINTLIGSASLVVLIGVYRSYAKKAKDLGKKYAKRTSFVQHLGVQAEIQKELEILVEHWIKIPTEKSTDKQKSDFKRILLVVEDIDRCPEDKIIEIVDALRVLLDNSEIAKRVVIIAAIDERILKRAIIWKYHKTLQVDPEINFNLDSEQAKAQTYSIVHEYMDKLFLAGVSLNSLMDHERIEIYENLIEGKVQKNYGLEDLDIAREDFKRKITEGAADIFGFQKDELLEAGIPDSEKSVSKISQSKYNSYELGSRESEELKLVISTLKEATPRQIRIFYYRYLLGKLILQRQLKALTQNTLFDFAYLLKKFSEQDRKDLLALKRQLLNQEGQEVKFDENWLLTEPSKDKFIAQVLFNTLETVIAY